MRTLSMCFSVLQDPGRIRYMLKGNPIFRPISSTRSWYENVNSLTSNRGRNCFLKPLGANTNRHSGEGLPPRQWISRKGNTGIIKIQSNELDIVVTKGTKIDVNKSKVSKLEIPDKVVAASVKLNVNESKTGDFDGVGYCDVQQNIEYQGDLQRLVTIIVFDIETTGLSRDNERIIEIALRDLNGGENSTFQTLINPDRYVSNTYIHGITTQMLRRPGVPRFKDLIPILLRYVRSRQKIPGSPVLFVGHNSRCFDLPFLINEFSRCSEEIPSNWLFLDTLPLARDLFKLKEKEGLAGKSLKALREYYGIPLEGQAHRSMSDVNVLSLVLSLMTRDLKRTVTALLEQAIKPSDVAMNSKKKKKSTN